MPDVAVGIGAKWEIESRGSLTDKLRFDQRVQYELVNLRDQIATIRVAITQTAPQQSYPVPEESGVPTVATLTHYSAQGGGTLSLDLNKTLPSSRTTSTVVQHTIIAQDKAEVKSGFPMKSEVKLKLRVSPQQ